MDNLKLTHVSVPHYLMLRVILVIIFLFSLLRLGIADDQWYRFSLKETTVKVKILVTKADYATFKLYDQEKRMICQDYFQAEGWVYRNYNLSNVPDGLYTFQLVLNEKMVNGSVEKKKNQLVFVDLPHSDTIQNRLVTSVSEDGLIVHFISALEDQPIYLEMIDQSENVVLTKQLSLTEGMLKIVIEMSEFIKNGQENSYTLRLQCNNKKWESPISYEDILSFH